MPWFIVFVMVVLLFILACANYDLRRKYLSKEEICNFWYHEHSKLKDENRLIEKSYAQQTNKVREDNKAIMLHIEGILTVLNEWSPVQLNTKDMEKGTKKMEH